MIVKIIHPNRITSATNKPGSKEVTSIGRKWVAIMMGYLEVTVN